MTSVSTTPVTAATTSTTAANNAAAAAAAANPTGAAALDQNFSQFLTLLTTQLQNQDPLSPMDTSQFTNQLVEFSQVEQQLQTNSTLTQMLTAQSSNLTAMGVSFIGKNVQAAGSTFTNSGGAPVNLAYSLPSTAAVGTVTIKDSNGNVVYTQPINTATGSHDFTWNGTNADGSAAAAGTYTLTVTAQDTTGNSLNVTGYVPGTVTGLETADNGTLMLNIGNQLVPMTSVREVTN